MILVCIECEKEFERVINHQGGRSSTMCSDECRRIRNIKRCRGYYIRKKSMSGQL